MYVFGGFSQGNDVESSIYRRSPDGTWTQIQATTPGGGLTNCASARIGDIAYIFGGRRAPEPVGVDTIFAFHIPSETFLNLNLPVLSEPRYELSASVLDGRIYAIGGGQLQPVTTVDEFDPVTLSIKTIQPLSQKRFGHVSVTIGNAIYVFGGNGGGGVVNSVEKLTRASNA